MGFTANAKRRLKLYALLPYGNALYDCMPGIRPQEIPIPQVTSTKQNTKSPLLNFFFVNFVDVFGEFSMCSP